MSHPKIGANALTINLIKPAAQNTQEKKENNEESKEQVKKPTIEFHPTAGSNDKEDEMFDQIAATHGNNNQLKRR